MRIFSKRNVAVGLATFIMGSVIAVSVWGAPGFWQRNTTVKSQVTAYLLDDFGAVNGLLLASGDQLHFGRQTGATVAAQIKTGDEVTAIGHAGVRSRYGREVRVQQISANGQTIIEAAPAPPAHGPHGRPGPDHRAGHIPPPPPAGTNPPPPPTGANPPPPIGAPAAPAGGAPIAPVGVPAPPAPETLTASGTIRAYLVNAQGEVHGLLLTNGEQARFSPQVGELLIAAGQGAQAQVTIEGMGVRYERGTVIRPARITIGSQTITVGQ